MGRWVKWWVQTRANKRKVYRDIIETTEYGWGGIERGGEENRWVGE